MALDKAFDKLRYGIEEDHRTARTRNRRVSMHAALIHLTIDPALAAAAAARFTSEILPRVRDEPWCGPHSWQDLGLQARSCQECGPHQGSSPDTGWTQLTARASVFSCSRRRNKLSRQHRQQPRGQHPG